MLTLIQLYALHISRIPGMDGVRALHSDVDPRYTMGASFTIWKGESEQPELLQIGNDSASPTV
jgi:hypothetical protein